MRTIEIDDDVYDLIRCQVKDFGDTPSIVLRRVLAPLKSKQLTVPNVSQVPTARPQSVLSAPNNGDPVAAFLNSPTYLVRGNVVEKFLEILSWLQKDKRDEFEKALLIRGRKRLYFAKTADELEASGNSVMPKRIPGGPFWVITNNSTIVKRQIIDEVMRVLGYPANARQAVLGTFH